MSSSCFVDFTRTTITFNHIELLTKILLHSYNFTMLGFVKSVILSVGLYQLASAADGTVTLYSDRDCKGTAMWTGNVGSKSRVVGGDQHEAVSFSYSGYFRLNLWDGSTIGSSKQCAYCSDYHEDRHEGGCINVSFSGCCRQTVLLTGLPD